MAEKPISINQTLCQICEINYRVDTAACDRCGQPAARYTTATRTAIDLDLDHPVLVHLTVGVHNCRNCRHYFRVQPPFMRRDAIYTNRVTAKAVQSVYQDNMAFRKVAERLARDFWVRPSEKTIRQWCRVYSEAFTFETDYQPWVVSEFSGILCIDEVYQDQLALLLAVDPAAPEGDRLVGYQLLTGAVDSAHVETFLTRLREVGIEPAEVITDGSSLYPAVLGKVWPQAAHQLCLFHETRRITGAVMKLINRVRRDLPGTPAISRLRGARSLRCQPPSHDANAPATRHWQRRQAERNKHVGWVHDLASQGLSQRAIGRQTGFSRPTIKKWLRMECPILPLAAILAEANQPEPDMPSPAAVKRRKIRQAHALASDHRSYSEIGRRVGAHRVTIKRWLQLPVPPEEEMVGLRVPLPEVPSPPPPWTDWEQVRQLREALQEHRFLLLRRPEHLNDEEHAQVAAILSSPVGRALQVGRDCLIDWYRIWNDEDGQRRTPAEAKRRFEAWQTNADYGAVPVLRQLQQRATLAKFDQLSHFLQRPEWEATNNGAERAGRSFRHRQSPHFNLRSKETIAGAITVMACMRMEAVTQPPPTAIHNCQRGCKKRMVESSLDDEV
jgi:transposase/transposase-like protein